VIISPLPSFLVIASLFVNVPQSRPYFSRSHRLRCFRTDIRFLLPPAFGRIQVRKSVIVGFSLRCSFLVHHPFRLPSRRLSIANKRVSPLFPWTIFSIVSIVPPAFSRVLPRPYTTGHVLLVRPFPRGCSLFSALHARDPLRSSFSPFP